MFLNRVAPPQRGATGRLLDELCQKLKKHGLQPFKLNFDISAHLYGYLIAWLAVGLRALLAPRAQTIVIMTDPPLLVFWAPLLKLRHRSRIIYWCHDVYPDLLPQVAFQIPNWLMQILKKGKNWALKSCDQIIVLGECMQNHLLQAYPASANKLQIIENWHEVKTAAVHTQKTMAELAPFTDLLNNHFIVLYAGNLGKLHPYETLVETALLLKDDPRFHFLISGYGQKRQACEQAVKEHQLPNISFLPYLSDAAISALQQRAQAHWACLSAAETGLAVPVKAMAAFAAGRPLLWNGQAHATTATMISKYGAGAIVQDAAQAAAQLHHWYQDLPAYAAACQGARLLHTEHTPDRQMQRWHNLLQSDPLLEVA